MALEYRLTLAGDIPVREIVDRALPGQAVTDGSQRADIDLYQERGLLVTVAAGRNGYFDAECDDEQYWEWEPDLFVNIEFRLDKQRLTEATSNMLTVVSRVLSTGNEDVALVLDGNALLLTRTDGAVRKHRTATWWDDTSSELIPEG